MRGRAASTRSSFATNAANLRKEASRTFFSGKKESGRRPPLSCGLLPGIQREKALRELHALECVLTLDDLRNADEVRIGNSVRGSGRVVSAVLEETGEELRRAGVRNEGA